MIVKSKKVSEGKVQRMESRGNIAEVIINTKLENLEKSALQVCFRGNGNSGIVEFSAEEAKNLYETLGAKMKLINSVKIIKDKL